MKILHVVTNSDLGGAPRVVTELSARAVRDGHPCAVAAAPGGPMWERLDPRVEQIPVASMRRAVEPSRDLRTLLFLRELYRSRRPDIVHLHSSKAGALGRLAALAAGGGLPGRCVYTIHGFDTILKTHRAFLPLERFLSRRCGAIVPVSAYDELNVWSSGLGGRIALVRNGVTDRRRLPSPDLAAAGRMDSARAEGRTIVLCIARLEPPKRPDLFLQAASLLPELRFFWAGNVGSPEKALSPGVRVPENVEFLGESPEAGNLANLCDVFLLVSDYEGLPMSVLEAMSCGKPVVASSVGGVAEALGPAADGSEPGVLVANEASAIAAALGRLASDGAARETMGQAARRRYEAGFTAEAMWGEYSKLYISLVGT